MIDAFDARRAISASGLLRAFNDAGVLAAADVHVARRLAALAGEPDEQVMLAAALAVRGPRLGHVCVDLATIAATASVDADEPVDLRTLAWPEPGAWAAHVAASALAGGPLHVAGTVVHLDRYRREEERVAAALRALAEAPPPAVDEALLAAGLARLLPEPGAQRLAAAAAVLRRVAVVAGGPGTGKTTTVARILALLAEQAAARGDAPPLVALAAPTGKAAARLAEAVHDEAAGLDVDDPVRAQLLGHRAATVHRLLGRAPRRSALPHDVVIVDEASMVSLSLMVRLVDAVRPGARLVLVGDPGQLASVEAGAVLADVAGPAAGAPRMRTAAAAQLGRVSAIEVAPDPAGTAIGDGIVTLRRVHRFGAAIGAVAEAIRRGDADATLAALAAGRDEVAWLPPDAGTAALRDGAVAAAREAIGAARTGDAQAALAALGAFRMLCAHRRGPYGVATWSARIEAWLAGAVPGFAAEAPWYPGRPLLVTANDDALGLFNGDTGVVVRTGAAGVVAAAFERRGEVVRLAPARLGAIETVHAMTIHKSQGSQFGTAAVLLPPPDSPLLTRELLYTGVTRARSRLLLVASEEAIRAAVARPVARASGLRERLWS
jgi:exodeoxyribonuclease V alpha subunit